MNHRKGLKSAGFTAGIFVGLALWVGLLALCAWCFGPGVGTVVFLGLSFLVISYCAGACE